MGKIDFHHTALLVTGTIVPNSIHVTHVDASQRRKEYFQALEFYASLLPQIKIFFLENSSYDFTEDDDFMKLFNKKNITLIKFPPSDKFEKGKGYQEFEMLDKTVHQLPSEYKKLVKVTGRYKVKNILSLLHDGCLGLIADCQKKFKVVQTNVFVCDRKFYAENIAGLYQEADDSKGTFIEKVVYNSLFSGGEREIRLFKANPVIEGISGSYGGTLRRNPLKQFARNIERKFLRMFGIKQFLIEY